MQDIATQIKEQINKNNNVLLYNEKLYDYYKKGDKSIKSVYISTPRKGKMAFELMLKKQDKDAQVKNQTISKLVEQIQENTKSEKLLIYLDSFQQLSQRELIYYKELERNININFIVNMTEDKKFIDEDFLDKFIILNDEYYNNRSQSINVTYPMLLLLSFLIFIFFLRLQLSVIKFLVNTLWFTLLMYRTIYYISR